MTRKKQEDCPSPAAEEIVLENAFLRLLVSPERGGIGTSLQYRKLILACAERYLDSEPDLEEAVYPGALGDAILHMVDAHRLTGEAKFLERADVFARIAVAGLLDERSPLPRASSRHDRYEAITRGDTMVMALLALWQLQHQPETEACLLYTDR